MMLRSGLMQEVRPSSDQSANC